ncbi:MAG: hypothetical protein IJC48_11555 [Clostridia bacterium]|nr:hypothetical protein [Clostridia bacterium]MBQ4157817.1 hypothetical protein [Clostridia bacterium]
MLFVGFPVWRVRKIGVVDTFPEAYDLSGKRAIPFCASGGGMRNFRRLTIIRSAKQAAL